MAVIDEVGFMNNLLESFGSLVDVTSVGGEKFGSIIMMGTGGDMKGDSTEQVKQIFYNPEEYNCIAVDDIFEQRGRTCIFIPAPYALNRFRDASGTIDLESATVSLLEEREKAKATKNTTTIQKLMQNRPMIPSEAFLTTSGNIFPIADLQEQLRRMEADTTGQYSGTPGRMTLSELGAQFQPDFDCYPCDFPVKEGNQMEGCVVIYHHPIANPPPGLYIAGLDPYNQDEAKNSTSLGSMFIMMRKTPGICNQDTIVAEYTGRPTTSKEFYENCRRLLMYYNALCLYENNFNGFKVYLEGKNSLKYLAYTPTSLTKNSSTNSRTYGLNMGSDKAEYELYLRDWLLEEVEENVTNIQYLYSKPLLKELIAYGEGNFDRAIALILCVCQKLQMQKLVVEQLQDKPVDPFWQRKLFTR